MSRLTPTFDRLKQNQRKALIPFITAGDPSPDFTVPLMHAMVAAGADIIELGVPFSDPMADGPVIQRASERALRHHMNLTRSIEMVSCFREVDATTPIVLMGYLNPIESMGYANFVSAAAKAGVDGVLTVDMPPEEAHDMIAALTEVSIDPIFLLAPTSSNARIQAINAVAKGYLYYVSLKGVTGASHMDVRQVEQKLHDIRQLTRLPIGVGFGVKDAATAAAIAAMADAVVVGSALIQCIEAGLGKDAPIQERIVAMLASMRAAMDNTHLASG